MAYRTHGGEPFHYVVRSYDERGRVEALMRFTENLGFDAVYYRYNSMNKVVSVHTLDAAGQHAAFYSYDHNGRMEAMWTAHSHLGLGELIFNQPAVSVRCVRAALVSRDPLAAADMTWSYDAADAIVGVTYPSVTGGIQTTITRNERGMLMRQNTTSAAPLAPPIFDQRINYHNDALITHTWSQSGTDVHHTSHEYDGARRVTQDANNNNGNVDLSRWFVYDRIGNRLQENVDMTIPQALYAYPPLPPGGVQPRHMNALMSITAGQDSDARTYTSDGALATRAVMRTSANGTTQRLEAWGYSALSLPEWYSLRSDAAAAGSTCTPDATLAPQHLWRYRYGPQQEREQKREWENGTSTQPLHWTYWLLGADGKQLATYHGVQGATCGGAATDVALWPVEYAAYAPLGTRVITRSNGAKEIVLADHLGSSRVVLAQQGYIAQSTAYTAYGEISHSEGDGARTGYIGRFAEPEGSFNLHGVRFYDPDAGSFTAVDPLWAKYAAWTPYQYAGNQPTVALDWNGDSVSIIIVMPSYLETEWSLVGHIAINIDGYVYSMYGDGKVYRPEYADGENGYLPFEAENKGAVEITLKNVDQAAMQQFLDSRMEKQRKDNHITKYNLITNSCITLALDALRAGGIPVNQPNGLIAPIEIGWLFSNPPVSDVYASNYQRHNERLIRRAERSFYREFLKLVDARHTPRNTVPLIKMDDPNKERGNEENE